MIVQRTAADTHGYRAPAYSGIYALHAPFKLAVANAGTALLACIGLAAHAQSSMPALNLSDSEAAWLRTHSVIRYSANPDNRPYSFVEDGVHMGVDASLLAEVANRLGTRLEFIASPTLEEALEKARTQEIDLVSGVTKSPERETFLDFSKVTVHVQYAVYTRKNAAFAGEMRDLAGKRIAVKQSVAAERSLQRIYPYVDWLVKADDDDALDSFQNGDAAAVIGPVGTFNLLVMSKGISDIRMQMALPNRTHLRIGVRRDWPELTVLLNKTLDSIPREESRAIKLGWIDPPRSSFTRQELMITVAAVFGAGLLLMVPVVAMKNRRISIELKEIRRLEANLTRLSMTDTLTGLHNRRYIETALPDEILRAGRYASDLSLLLFDLDHFKEINDCHGHAQGDRVLIAFADTMRGILRNTDIACRYGGEEFLVVVPHTNLVGAQQLAERIRKAVEESNPYGARITTSAGVAELAQCSIREAHALIAAADKALYLAKTSGRNRICAASSSHANGMHDAQPVS